MNKFEMPMIMVVEFDVEDVITTSTTGGQTSNPCGPIL